MCLVFLKFSLFWSVVSTSGVTELPGMEDLAQKVPSGVKITLEELSSSCRRWAAGREVLKTQVRVDLLFVLR